MIRGSRQNGRGILTLDSKNSVNHRRDEAPVGVGQEVVLPPDSEVSTKGKRRVMTAAYKARILRKADACMKPGDIGALLRREGLYSSHLKNWRQKRDEGLVPQKRGRKKDPATAERHANAKLQREIERLAERLRHAELIIEVQKKVAALLGNPLPSMPAQSETK